MLTCAIIVPKAENLQVQMTSRHCKHWLTIGSGYGDTSRLYSDEHWQHARLQGLAVPLQHEASCKHDHSGKPVSKAPCKVCCALGCWYCTSLVWHGCTLTSVPWRTAAAAFAAGASENAQHAAD